MFGSGYWPYYTAQDLVAIMQAYSQGMLMAFQMGREARNMDEQDKVITGGQQYYGEQGDSYIGIFDRGGYGVYNNQDALSNSEPYWDKNTRQMKEFKTIDAALAYARNGVAMLRQLDMDMLPDMQYPVNWRQRV